MNAAVLQLLPEQRQIIRTHAERIYPDECCGIILGDLTSGCKTVVEVIPTVNVWNPDEPTEYTTRRRYAIAPSFMLQAQRDARNRNINIIGIYHSHPDYPAIPSECDRLYAWPEYSYIIVSVQNKKAGELLSWSLDESHQFQAETIEYINFTI